MRPLLALTVLLGGLALHLSAATDIPLLETGTAARTAGIADVRPATLLPAPTEHILDPDAEHRL